MTSEGYERSPPARSCMRGRWWWHKQCRTPLARSCMWERWRWCCYKTHLRGLLLHARDVIGSADGCERGAWEGGACPNVFLILVIEAVKVGEPITARLLAYLAGLPYHGSPLIFPTCYQLTSPPEIHRHRHWVAYIPQWRGEARWQRVWVCRVLKSIK